MWALCSDRGDEVKMPPGLEWEDNNLKDLTHPELYWVACIGKVWPTSYSNKDVWAWRLPNHGWRWDTTVTRKREAQMAALAMYLVERKSIK